MRRTFTAEEKASVFELWKNGTGFSEIAKKPCLLDQNLPLRKLVLEKLEMKWSPEQISGWLRRTKPRQKTLRISPETIYKTLYFRSREALHHLNIQHL